MERACARRTTSKAVRAYGEFRRLDYQVNHSTLDEHRKTIAATTACESSVPFADLEPRSWSLISETDTTVSLTTRTTCRICGSTPLTPVIDLGDQCIAGAFRPPQALDMPEPKLPLQLVRCDPSRHRGACGLVQLRHTVPGSILYSSYWYRSGINRSMTENLHEIAAQARRRGRRSSIGRHGRRHRLQRRNPPRRVSGSTSRPHPSRDRSLGRNALRRREGL